MPSLLRGAVVAEAPVTLPLRARPAPPPPLPGSPEAVMEGARRDAEHVIAAAHAEAESLRAAAHQEGYAAGHAVARDEVAQVLSALLTAGGALAARAEELEREAGAEATALAVEIAAKLLRAEVAVRPERVADVVRGAIRRAADRSALVVMVSPSDLAACRAAAPEILAEMGGIGRLDVVDDPRIGAGSCVLQTVAGDVDATFESQLARVLEALAAPPDESLVEPRA
ncbi:MAG: FliH/SctL family protein [Thermoleophilia bacterium]